MSEEAIQLGDKVRDRLTGFEGVATGRHEYLYGCTRFTVSPVVLKDGHIAGNESFDEPQLEVLERAAFVPMRPVGSKTGGTLFVDLSVMPHRKATDPARRELVDDEPAEPV